jgi:hypothetical protein
MATNVDDFIDQLLMDMLLESQETAIDIDVKDGVIYRPETLLGNGYRG